MTETLGEVRPAGSAGDRLDTPVPATLKADFYNFQADLSPVEQQAVLRLRTFLEQQVRPIADDYWDRAEFPREIIRPLADLGMFGLQIPSTARFENSSVFRGWAALEMGRVDASTATFVGVQSGLSMNSIALGGSPEQQQTWLPPMSRGELIGAFGLTEPLSGSDSARGLRTTAERRGDTWVLDGAKRWIGNATFADVVVIWARDVADQQVKGFLVRRGTPGFSTSKIQGKQSLRIVQNADIVLQGVEVDEADRLPEIRSFEDVATVLRLTRAGVAWQSVGVAIGAYEAALRYVGEREQFGKPIASYQLVQDRLAQCLGNITACIALCVQVSRMEDEDRQSHAHAALAKSYATSRMREVVAWCRELLGGNGITLAGGVARYFGDAEALYSLEGTRDMSNLIVGRDITGVSAFV
ncbi:acyl-CoA dehydrogenase family protein [Kineosporia rhizophila]|uniref:acyl-CoA dehydrogenase family protein n=1 Tax=Kineosporia rhizophila TaxID=84633 RepID=UPI001E4B5D44|nr:acyl-CoA dehydrogenase family protein [Kineosporia rhizophila]MCE0536395.1 acyl-CoA dehydrogenase family protein [Kineosporia rhizophila]